jgi:lipid-A-disaccharide synthase-like uncharacterized protein
MLNALLTLSPGHIWLTVGLLGQGLFFMRFLVQWLASEKAGRSVMPTAFWYFSLAGGVVLLVYALYRGDPVFILGQGTGLFIYVRNLRLITRPQSLPQSEKAHS